jgi:hypothetical protein
MITYCKECNKSVLMPNPIPEGNQDPDGFIVCKKCYWLNYSPQKIRSDKRDSVLKYVLRRGLGERIMEWYKSWIR